MAGGFQKRWGHLRVLNRKRHSLRYRGKHLGQFSETWTVKCDCGNVIDIDSRMFPGRSVMRSCGLANCTFTTTGTADALVSERKRGRPKRSDPTHTVLCYFPIRVYEMVELYWEMRRKRSPNITKQTAIMELVTGGWEALKTPSLIQPDSDSTNNDI